MILLGPDKVFPDEDPIDIAEKKNKNSAMWPLSLAFLQAYVVYTFRDSINLIVGIGMFVAFILFFGIRKKILLAPLLGLSILVVDVVSTLVAIVMEYIVFKSVLVGAVGFLIIRIPFIVGFTRTIQSIEAYWKMVNASSYPKE